tara:strand:- start:7007 stop:7909 length:903 start_codon:yes stop_codon:yes gene_type:complete
MFPLVHATIDVDTDGNIPDYFSIFFTNATTKSMVGDFSSIPRNFTIQPPANETWRVSRLIVTIIDTNVSNFADYGAISALSNGLRLGAVLNGTTFIFNPLGNLSQAFMIKTNGDWASIMFDLEKKSLGAGDDYVVGRWTFDKAGTKIRLEGSKGDFVFVQLSDDLSGLSDHLLMAEGYKERPQEDSTMPIAIILVVIFVISVYFFVLVKLITEREFTEHGLIKLFFYLLAYWILLLPINMAIQYNDFNGGPAVVTQHLELMYELMIYINWFVLVYFILWLLVQILKKIGNTKNKLRLGNG